jgi:hypothetical protein
MLMRSAPAVTAAVFMLAVSPALACKGSKVQFTDDFRQVDSSWTADPDAVSVEDGKVKIKADAGLDYLVIYKGPKFTEADLCVTVQMPSVYGGRTQLGAGAVFWALSYDDYYALLVQPDGRAALAHFKAGNMVPVVNLKGFDSIRTQPGDKNVLRVTTSSNNVTAYINDVKFVSFNRRSPEGGGQFGLYARSEYNHRDTWKFSDLKVTDLAKP